MKCSPEFANPVCTVKKHAITPIPQGWAYITAPEAEVITLLRQTGYINYVLTELRGLELSDDMGNMIIADDDPTTPPMSPVASPVATPAVTPIDTLMAPVEVQAAAPVQPCALTDGSTNISV
ncbi:Aste57867_20304 [Aphanomyces stellatus]|uniref:Aste57867_20304 protein n=1 Tax=Aphanomyces stellatus TaxID=120398 RepID=A0A485LGN7_9STRA|nr:hypothetical protein As57867_020238 [Aphanomyces stellatus]KAF0711136.1 hypothetical protein As57867_005363 [Aphanomyces stellatus]KAF0712213.1 hypothetical protein As57867_004886 [Aphanomyces stellatus]VFT81991.1 Aste57867_4899 [Aphanomyces stellatus]VFT82435.1 Aste57867_5376 [Aphanomyces stellatus]